MRQLLRVAVLAATGMVVALAVQMMSVPIAAQEIMPTPTPTPSASPTPTPTVPGYVKIPVPGSSTSASTNDGNVPANSVDGNLGTRWSGFGNGAWLQFDLGTARHLGNVKVAAHLGNQRANMFEIHTSGDAMSWNPTLMGARTSGTTTQLESFSLPGTPLARYVRYVGRGNSGPTKAGWNSVSEIEVFGAPSSPPAAPTNLRAQPGAGRVTLTWNAPAAQFQIWRRLSQCDTYTQVGTSTAATFTDTNVVDRQHYYYYVVAVNTVGTSPPSNPIAVTPQIQPPPAPTVTATSGPADSGRVDLSWNAITGATRYTVKRTTANVHCTFNTPGPIATVNAPATTYTDTTAVPGVTYYYVVSATNITGEGADSERVLVMALRDQAPTPPPTPTPCPTGTPVPTPIPPTSTPPAPHSLAIEDSNGRVRLTWGSDFPFPNGPKSFSVYRATVSCGPYVQVARKLLPIGSPFQYVDSGLTNGTTYYYFVVGTNDLGDGLDSETVGATPRHVPPPVPGAPVIGALQSALRLHWTSSFAADSYTVKRGTASGGPYAPLASVPVPASGGMIYDDTSVTPGTTYYYVIEAVNGAGPSGNSPQASGVGPGGQVMPPAGLFARSDASGILLTWNAVANATGYRVYRADSLCSGFMVIGSPTGTSFVHGIGGHGRHLYRVAALSGSTEGDPSTIVTATPGGTIPSPTLNVTDGASLQLSWSPQSSAIGYRIYRELPYRSDCAPPRPQLLQTVGAVTSYNDSVVSPGIRYDYSVQGVYGGLPGPFSSSRLGTVTGTNEFPTPRPIFCPTGTPTPTPAVPTGPATPPTNVTATAADRQVTVTWNNGTGVYGYRLYRATNTCGPFVLVGGRSYWDWSPIADVGLANGVTYHYVVVALDAQGDEIIESPTASAMPSALPPKDRPRYVFAVAGNARVQVLWTPAYGATSYLVRRSSGTLVGTSSTDSLVDTNVLNGVAYSYHVVPVNASGQGPASANTEAVTPRETHVEVTPSASAVTGSTHDGNVPANTVDNSLATRWSGNGNGAWVQLDLGTSRRVTHLTVGVYQGNLRRNRFDIHLSGDGVNFTPHTGYVTSGTTTAEQAHDVPDTWARYVRYVGRGATINATGASSTWNSVTEVSIFAEPGTLPTPTPTPTPFCSTPPPTPTPAPPPSNVVATAGDGRVTIQWSSSYQRNRVSRSTTAGGPYAVIADLTGSSQGQYVDTDVVNGTRYFYVVQIYDHRTSEPGCPPWTWTLSGPPSAEVSAVPGTGTCAEWVPPAQYVPQSSPWDPVTDPRNLFDNDLSTRWSANGDGAWFKVDLGATRTLCSFSMAVYRGDTRKQVFDLQVSGDNASWTNVLMNARSSGTTTQQEMYELPDTSARWVRWLGHGNVSNTGTPGSWNSLTEVDFFVR